MTAAVPLVPPLPLPSGWVYVDSKDGNLYDTGHGIRPGSVPASQLTVVTSRLPSLVRLLAGLSRRESKMSVAILSVDLEFFRSRMRIVAILFIER